MTALKPVKWNAFIKSFSNDITVMGRDDFISNISPLPVTNAEVLLPKKGAPERGLVATVAFASCSVLPFFFPGSFINSPQLAGRKWPAGCKMATAVRFSLLCIKKKKTHNVA